MTGSDAGTCNGPFAYGTAQLADVAGRKLSRVTENPEAINGPSIVAELVAVLGVLENDVGCPVTYKTVRCWTAP